MADDELHRTVRDLQRAQSDGDWYARARRLWPSVRNHLHGIIKALDRFFA